jgi:multimeric flavodoxin WrbA
MNVLILNGLNGFSSLAMIIKNRITSQCKDSTIFDLAKLDIKDCLGCFGCWIKTPGECVIDDPAREISRSLVNSDLVVMITPIIFGGYGYHLKKVLDRQINILQPFFRVIDEEVHHQLRYSKNPDFLLLGVLDNPDAVKEQIFKELFSRNIKNLQPNKEFVEVLYISEATESINTKISNAVQKVGVVNV